jgi:hypothetical protein
MPHYAPLTSTAWSTAPAALALAGTATHSPSPAQCTGCTRPHRLTRYCSPCALEAHVACAVCSRVSLSPSIQLTNYLQVPPPSEEATQAMRVRQELQSCLGVHSIALFTRPHSPALKPPPLPHWQHCTPPSSPALHSCCTHAALVLAGTALMLHPSSPATHIVEEALESGASSE